MIGRRCGQALIGGFLVVAVTAAACGGGKVEVAQAAVREVGTVVGSSRGTLELTAGDVTHLASEAGVAEGVIRDTAPKLDNETLWSQSMTNLHQMYEATPDEVRSNLVSIACDGVRGKITTAQQLEENIAERFADYSPSEGQQLANDVLGLWQNLYEARTSSDPNLQASAVLTCFTVEQMVG